MAAPAAPVITPAPVAIPSPVEGANEATPAPVEKPFAYVEGPVLDIEEIILHARERKCSDIHITAGGPVQFRIFGKMEVIEKFRLSEAECSQMILNTLDEKQRQTLFSGNDVDFAIQTRDGNRQRVNIFRDMGHLAATIRLLNNEIPSLESLGLPMTLQELADQPRGMILVTGPTGSGKSTTLAAMIDYINTNRPEHIITIEDPVEYVYEAKKALIHQREVGRDVPSFAAALRSALREDPDIILVGEMRDYETISAALTAAETGHLVMSTLHTTGAAQTIDRVIDACPASTQNQVRTQLAGVLKGVITQCLVPRIAGGRVAATEILTGTDAVLNMIRENKCHQLNTTMQAGAIHGMHTLNNDLMKLVRQGIITPESAMRYTNDKREMETLI
ncbi:MAG: type IV pilus twitching motility protein PilT [bacterium]|nr:type IV pilus twitching motility protein PilT [bacterium]